MNAHRLRRQLRKELLLLQAEQHRQSLAQELGAFVRFSRILFPSATAERGAASWAERGQLLLPLLMPSRWRKYLVYALALKKLAQAFSTRPD